MIWVAFGLGAIVGAGAAAIVVAAIVRAAKRSQLERLDPTQRTRLTLLAESNGLHDGRRL